MQAVLRRTLISSSPLLRHPVTSLSRSWRPSGFRNIVTKKFTAEHECVAFDDASGLGVITITDHAQSSLGDVVFVELPKVGTNVAQHEQIGAVESVKAASDIYAPVSGTIEAINEELSGQPSLLNKSPEEKGWLCKIKLSNPSELDELMDEEQYRTSHE